MEFVLELNVLVFVTTRVVYKAAISCITVSHSPLVCFFEPFAYLIIAFGAN